MKIDWLRSVGKTVLFSIEGNEGVGVEAQKIAALITAVNIHIRSNSVTLIIPAINLRGDNIAEKITEIELFDTETRELVIGVLIGDEEDSFGADVHGAIIEVY
jgi:hypothetical protein